MVRHFFPLSHSLSLSPSGFLTGSGPNANQQTSVEELLAFIEGEEGGEGGSGQGGGVNSMEAGPVSGGPSSSGAGGGGKAASKKGKKKSKKPVSYYNYYKGEGAVPLCLISPSQTRWPHPLSIMLGETLISKNKLQRTKRL